MRVGQRYDAVIWDFDGTIMDTYPAIVGAYHAVADIGLGLPISRDEVWRLAKVRLGVCRQAIAEQAGASPERVQELYLSRYEQRDIRAEELFPGAIEALRAVVIAGGRNFLVTHRSRRSLDQYFEVHDLARYFVESIAMLEAFPPKPSPAAFRYLIHRHGLDAERTLGVGDRPLDVEAALNAGVDACFFDPDGALDARARFCVSHLKDLLQLL